MKTNVAILWGVLIGGGIYLLSRKKEEPVQKQTPEAPRRDMPPMVFVPTAPGPMQTTVTPSAVQPVPPPAAEEPPPPPPPILYSPQAAQWVAFAGCFNAGRKYRVLQSDASDFDNIAKEMGVTVKDATVAGDYVEFVYAGTEQNCVGGAFAALTLEEWS